MARATALPVPAPDAAVIRVKVVPGSSRDRVVGRYGDALKVQVAAPPEKGKANAAVAALLAELFGVKPARVQLVSGASNPQKQFRVAGVTQAAADATIAALG